MQLTPSAFPSQMRGFAAFAVTVFAVLGAPALAQMADEDLYAVYFRSDACPNCLILDPALADARAQTADMPIKHITLDMSASSEHYDAAMYAMLDRGLADLLNSYLGLTGIVFLLDPETALPVDCLTRLDDTPRLIQRLRIALEEVGGDRTDPGASAIGSTCPSPLRELPDGRIYGSG